MCSDPHKQIQKHFLKRNQTYIPTVYLGVIISLLNVLWGSVNIGGRSKLRRGDWTWFSFSMTLANCNHWREIDYQMMMTKINNFYNIDVLYFEFNKKIYIYVNGLTLSIIKVNMKFFLIEWGKNSNHRRNPLS